MIEVDEPIFPNNVITLVAAALEGIDEDIEVIKRPLRNDDPQQSIGIFAQSWAPEEESIEMMGASGPVLPTIQSYLIGVQAFVRDGDKERGLAIHSVLSQRVRRVLYSHGGLRVALRELKVEFLDGSTESLLRWAIQSARYFSGEIEKENLYLATLEFRVETETNTH